MSTSSRETRKKRSNQSSPPLAKKQAKDTKEISQVQPQDRNSPWYTAFTKGDEEYDTYMREEWGFEKRGTQPLFEKICLEGAQSGLSWLTILRKREAYRRAFHKFDPEKIQFMTSKDVEKLLAADGSPANTIVRHRGKIQAVIHNSKSLLALERDKGIDFDEFIWSFVDNKPILNRWKAFSQVPTKTAESEAMSKGLKKAGFKFVGPTTCYAFMQSCGLVIDHIYDTPEWKAAETRLQQRKGGFQEGRC